MDAAAVPAPPARDWSELPLDALSVIFTKVGAVDVLLCASFVCHSWLDASKQLPEIWRRIDVASVDDEVPEVDVENFLLLRAVVKVAVDRSDGQLEELVLGNGFVNDELLEYIAERSPSLKTLCLSACDSVSNIGFTKFITRTPQLEELVLSSCANIGGEVYEFTGKACPQLKCLKVWKDQLGSDRFHAEEGQSLGIATMHELRSLSIHGTDIVEKELMAIVDNCPHLELLCIRNCFDLDVNNVLRAKCERIRELTIPAFINTDFRCFLA